MNVLEWVERVFWRCEEIREDGGRVRGQVMALGSAMLGTWCGAHPGCVNPTGRPQPA